MKKIVALMLVLVMALSVCACAGVETNGDNAVANTDDSNKQSEVIKDSNNDGQIEVGTVDNVEVNEADEHLPPVPASWIRTVASCAARDNEATRPALTQKR